MQANQIGDLVQKLSKNQLTIAVIGQFKRGKTTMVNVSSDVVLAVKAKAGQVDAVKAALEARRDAVAASFEMYLADQFDKANAGRIITKGDYALLVIGGDTQEVVEYDSEDAMFAAIDEVLIEGQVVFIKFADLAGFDVTDDEINVFDTGFDEFLNGVVNEWAIADW